MSLTPEQQAALRDNRNNCLGDLYEQCDRSTKEIAARTGIARSTIGRWLSANGLTNPAEAQRRNGQKARRYNALPDDDTFTLTLEPHPKRPDECRTPEQITRDHGADPETVELVSFTDNYWRGNDGEGPAFLTQSKATFKPRRTALTLPPRPEIVERRNPRVKPPKKSKTSLIAIVADQHCPHHDLGLHECWLAWLEQNQPDKIILLGDLLNLSKPSRHRPNLSAKYNDDPDECLASGRQWLAESIAAAPSAELEFIAGNHDLRVQIAVMERLPELYEAKRPGEDYPWWDLSYWLGFDAYGVTYHRADGEYHSVEVEVAPGLQAAHGAKAGPFGGAAKDKDRIEGSRLVGHDHKQVLSYTVRYRDREAHQHLAVSVGTMARRDLGYTPLPDTVQGFGSVAVHADGYWNVELARYDDRRKTLVWRDQRYTAR